MAIAAPSFEVAQETDEAVSTLMPAVLLHPDGFVLSADLLARLDEAGIKHHSFPVDRFDPSVARKFIKSLVLGWLDGHYPAICDAARRRSMLQSRFSPLREAIRSAQGRMPVYTQHQRLRAFGLTLERALKLLSDEEFTRCSGVEMLALADAYEVPFNLDAPAASESLDRPEHLTASEWRALNDLANKEKISAEEVILMAMEAQSELARRRPAGSRRRHSYESDTKWRQIRDRVRGGR